MHFVTDADPSTMHNLEEISTLAHMSALLLFFFLSIRLNSCVFKIILNCYDYKIIQIN